MDEHRPTPKGFHNRGGTDRERTGNRRVALVTGGAVRLGRAITVGLAERGWDLLLHYNRSEAEAETAAARVRGLGRRAHVVQADLTEEAGAVALCRKLEKAFGKLDLLVNSAASFVSGDILDTGADEWDAVLALNLRAPFLLIRETAPLLRARRGSVVNIADLSAVRPWTSHPHHSVAKAGLLQLTRIAAGRLAPDVRVNAVAPGDVLSPKHFDAEDVARVRRMVPLAANPSPEDVVRAVVFLASASYVTGETLVVDGGESLGW